MTFGEGATDPSPNPHTPYNRIDILLVGCGRPIVCAPDSPPTSATGTIVVH